MAETRKSGEMVHQKGGFAVREREIRDNVDQALDLIELDCKKLSCFFLEGPPELLRGWRDGSDPRRILERLPT